MLILKKGGGKGKEKKKERFEFAKQEPNIFQCISYVDYSGKV